MSTYPLSLCMYQLRSYEAYQSYTNERLTEADRIKFAIPTRHYDRSGPSHPVDYQSVMWGVRYEIVKTWKKFIHQDHQGKNIVEYVVDE